MGTARVIRLVVGIVLLLVGIVWFFQGIGTIGNSSMSGHSFWAFAGIVVFVVGAVLILKRGKRA